MTQIKVLDLNNSNSLSELSYEDAQKVNGGAVGAAFGFGYSLGRSFSFSQTGSNSANYGQIGGFLGSSLGYVYRGASAGLRFGAYGASLSG